MSASHSAVISAIGRGFDGLDVPALAKDLGAELIRLEDFDATVAAVLAAAAACSLLLRHAGRTVCANDSEIMLHPSPATPFV